MKASLFCDRDECPEKKYDQRSKTMTACNGCTAAVVATAAVAVFAIGWSLFVTSTQVFQFEADVFSRLLPD